MRCVGSSPAAASALRNRLAADPERLAEQVFDEDDEEGDAVDLEPTSGLEQDGPLAALVAQAESLAKVPDLKLDTLVKLLDPLIAEGANPVVFCRSRPVTPRKALRASSACGPRKGNGGLGAPH